MKLKRLLLLLTLLLSSWAAASTVTLTGTINDPSGSGPFTGTVTFRLNTVARQVSTNRLLLPVPITYTVTNGTVQSSPAATLVGVDDMNPSGTAYSADYFSSSGTLIAEYYIAPIGTTFDLGTASFTPTTINNVSYQNLAGVTIDANTSALSHVLQSTAAVSPGGDTVLVANTTTSIVSKAVTMPSSGGPFRVLASSTVNFTQTNPGTTACWVSDATNSFAGTQSGSTAGVPIIGMNGFQVSPVTYANSAAVTFTLVCRSNAGMTINLASTITGGQNTTLSVSVISAN